MVIAIFYSKGIHVDALAAAAGIVVVIVLLRWLGSRWLALYLLLGIVLWVLVHDAGVHATLAGVVLGLLTPARPTRQRDDVPDDDLLDVSTPEAARQTALLAREAIGPAAWIEYVLHPWSSFVIVPLFALANAGIPLSASAISDAASSRITYGVLIGLVVGKLVGVSAFSWLATRIRLGSLPEGATWGQIVGVGAVAGIGFTVAIFVSGLAFDDVALQDQAKIGILAASVLAGALGAVLLTRSAAQREPEDSSVH